MSDYALEWFDHLITEILAAREGADAELTGEKIIEYSNRAQQRRERIRLMLTRQLFSLKEERMLEALVGQYQSCLVMLLDRLDGYSKEQRTPEFRQLIASLSAILQDLLHFIETYFSKYFDMRKPVPRFYLLLQQKAWRQPSKEFPEKSGEDEMLLASVQRACQFFLGASTLSYQQLQYGKAFFEAVGQPATPQEKEIDAFSPLESSLIYLNFNDALFQAYLIKKIEAMYSGVEEPSEQAQRLQLAYLVFRQIGPKPGFIFNEELPSLQETVKQWVNFQTNKLNQTMNEPQARVEGEGDKIQLSVSVAMLGLFVRLLAEEKIITTSNQSALIRFFASSFATSKQSSISAESLYGSYFKPQPGTVKMMNECLLRLQQCLRKKF